MEQQSKKKKSEMPLLCANNCGFFGNSSTNNLCSKCYKDSFLMKSKAPIESIPSPEFTKITSKIEKEEKSEEIVTATVTSSSSSTASFGESKGPKNRCNFCNKKVGLMGFKCKCGELFCSIHRYSDKHHCEFDYRGQGKEAITKANPVVKLDKVQKI